MFTDDLAQPSSDSIAHNRRADAFRRDESGAKWISIRSTGARHRFLHRKHTQDEGSSALRAAFLFHPFKLGRSCEPSRLGKGKGARHVQPYTRSTFLCGTTLSSHGKPTASPTTLRPGNQNYGQQNCADEIKTGIDKPKFCRLRFPNTSNRHSGAGKSKSGRHSELQGVI